MGIPHIYHTSFYCYAYSFGQLLVLSLYQRYKAEGESFKPKYLKILAYGGSESPTKILAEAGIDIALPAFWQGGFDVVKGMIDALEMMEERIEPARSSQPPGGFFRLEASGGAPSLASSRCGYVAHLLGKSRIQFFVIAQGDQLDRLGFRFRRAD